MASVHPTLSPQVKAQLILTPSMTESLTVLSLPFDELQEHVTHIVEENPLLEFPHELASPLAPSVMASNRELAADDLEPLESYNETDALVASWRDAYRESRTRTPKTKQNDFLPEDAFQQKPLHQDRLNTLNAGANPFDTLEENLRLQLSARAIPDKMRTMCHFIVSYIDDKGFLDADLDTIATACNMDMRDANGALGIVQSLEPRGVGARDVRECLILQLDTRDPDFDVTRRIIAEDLEDIARGQVSHLCKKYHLEKSDVARIAATIKELDPHPASQFARERTAYRVPDIIIENKPEGIVVSIAGDDLETLVIDADCLAALERQHLDDETKRYLDEKKAEASQLIVGIRERNATLRRFALYLVEKQSGFFSKGPAALQPLTMQQAADDLDVSVSTISRIANGKSVLTPWGTLPAKSFFSRKMESDRTGNRVSATQVKEFVGRFIASEDSSLPLSDQDIANLVETQTGAAVARRTIAKYRAALGIPNQAARRKRY